MALRRANIITNDVVNATTSLADVTALEFPAVINVKYWFKFSIIYSTNASSTGAAFAVNGPAATYFGGYGMYQNATGTMQLVPFTALNTSLGTGTGSSTSIANVAILEGYIQPSATGTVIARFLSEVAVAAGVTVRAGSKVEWHEA